MPRTITGTTTTGILLTTPTDSPVTIVSGALIESTPGNFALIGGSLKGQPDYNFPWTITNSGFVEGKGGNSTGVGLYGGGKIVNADIGYISGGRRGKIQGTQATVVNYGTIRNRANPAFGVDLDGFLGNFVTNGPAGYIEGDVIETGATATLVTYISAGKGSITNYGAISGFFSG